MQDKTSSLVFLHYLTTVFDNIKDAILLIDVQPRNVYRLILANKVFLTTSGFPADSVGKKVSDIVNADGYAFLKKQYETVIKTKKTLHYTRWSDVPVGKRAFEVQLIPTFNTVGEVKQIIALTRDVTELAELKEEVRNLRAELKDKEK